MKMTFGRLEVDVQSAGKEHTVLLTGQLDERAELAPLIESLRDGRVTLDLSSVSFINSLGVREWIRLLHALREQRCEVVLRKCSEAMVHQMNMIVETTANTTVESFYAPYYCPRCGYEASMLVEVAPHKPILRQRKVPAFSCPECREAMQLNELPERYLLFVAPEQVRG